MAARDFSTCGDCRHFDDKGDPTTEFGRCTRFPPVLLPLPVIRYVASQNPGSAWERVCGAVDDPLCWGQPAVTIFNWCGEWQPEPKPEDQP